MYDILKEDWKIFLLAANGSIGMSIINAYTIVPVLGYILFTLMIISDIIVIYKFTKKQRTNDLN